MEQNTKVMSLDLSFPVIGFQNNYDGNEKYSHNAEVDVNDRVMDIADGILLFTYYRAW